MWECPAGHQYHSLIPLESAVCAQCTVNSPTRDKVTEGASKWRMKLMEDYDEEGNPTKTGPAEA